MGKLQRELAKVNKRNKNLQLQAEIARSKLDVERNMKVYEDYKHIDASKTLSVSDDVSSNLLAKFGRGKPVKEVLRSTKKH